MRVVRHTPEWLFEQGWRLGDPHRRGISLRRRLVTLLVFASLLAVIGGYVFLTDARRVRRMAQQYLGDLVGGTVEVRSASLSVFEGLRLEGLRISTPDGQTVFSAGSLQVSYEPSRLLRGRLHATRLLATDAVVRMVEYPNEGRWNFQSLRQGSGDTSVGLSSGGARAVSRLPRLPEIVLRNARVEYAECRQDQTEELGRLSIEGQLEPIDGQLYRFRLTTRGRSDPIGPAIEGTLSLRGEFIEARLPRFEVGRDLQSMLPSRVRSWWTNHALGGAVRVPLLRIERLDDGTTSFNVEVSVDGVSMRVEPALWMGGETLAVMRDARRVANSLASLGLDERSIIERARDAASTGPAELRDVAGTFRFSPTRVEIDALAARYYENVVRVDGVMDGYEPGAPMRLTIASSESQPLRISESPDFLHTLPPRAREIYHRFRPRGIGSVVVEIRRDRPFAPTSVSGRLDVSSGQFTFDRIPYPVHDAKGRIRFGVDRQTGREELVIEGLRGSGVPGSVNADAVVELRGRVSPLDHSSAVQITVTGTNVSSDATLLAALPPRTRRVLRALDADKTGRLPRFSGDFVCEVTRTPGDAGTWNTTVDVDVRSGEARIVSFPYPLTDVRVNLRVEDDRIRVSNGRVRRGNMELAVEGSLRFPEASFDGTTPGVSADLRLRGESVPIDRELIDALPSEVRQAVERLQLSGTIDFDGRAIVDDTSEPQFDLTLRLRDGSVRPRDSSFTLRDVSAMLRLRTDVVLLQEMTARHGDATVTGHGVLRRGKDGSTAGSIELSAKALPFDENLRSLLPDVGRGQWDRIRPAGSADVLLAYSLAPDSTTTYRVQVDPQRMSIAPPALPFPLEEVAGRVILTPAAVELIDLQARHGATRFTLSGTLANDSTTTAGELRGSVVGLTLDDKLLASLPSSLAEPLRSIDARGSVDLSVERWRRRFVEARREEEFDLLLSARDVSCNPGIPVVDASGQLKLGGVLLDGVVRRLDGQIELQRATLAGRSLRQARATLQRSPGSSVVALRDIRGSLADGELAGQVEIAPANGSPGRYALSLVLRGADLRQLTGADDDRTDARLTASVALEGRVGETSSRRGRGDVVVQGKELYQLPVLLGLFHVTNLSLPIRSPFDRGSASYGVVGDRLTIEQLELRAADLRLSGSGVVDFSSRAVSLDFTTDAAWARLPLIGEFLQGARNELLQLRVRGTLQEPRVGAGAFGTLTTTIDEVLQAPR